MTGFPDQTGRRSFNRFTTLIRNALWKAVMLLPLKQRLPARVWLIENDWSSFEAEWLHLSEMGPNRGMAIDIGTNRGLYAFKLAQLYGRVIAFEPNSAISMELAALSCPNIELRAEALSSEPGSGVLYIPRTNREELDGWGSFDPEPFPSAISYRSCLVPKQTLDAFSFSDVGFIKIDVEGHELEVLQGARATLATSHPVILVEIRPANEEAIFQLLRTCGYDSIDYAAKVGGNPSTGLFLFQHNEHPGKRN